MSQASRESVQTAGATTPDPPESTAGAVEIQGFEEAVTDTEAAKNWQPVSDRKIRVGIAATASVVLARNSIFRTTQM